MTPVPINLADKLNQFDEHWSPKTVAEMDGFQFRLAKLHGDFVWHRHEDSDEAFFVIRGRLRIDFRDGSATLGEGEMLVVPKGVEHKPFAASECQVMVLVREGTVNTGDGPTNAMTADPDARI